MDEVAAYRVGKRAAFLRNIGYTAWRELPRFFFAFWGLVLATHFLSQAGLGQSALDIPAMLSRGTESTRSAADEDSATVGAAPRRQSDSGDTVLFANAEGPFTLGGGAVRIPLRPISLTSPEEGLLISRVDTLKRGRSIYLVIRDLRAESQPGVLYHLYLDLPAGTKPVKNDPHYVGSLNFYNSAYDGSAPKSDFFFSYDITSVARKLRSRRLLGGRTALTVLPASAPLAGSAPTIGRVELVEQ